jgi:hypothetical protein
MNSSQVKKPLKDVDVRRQVQFVQIYGWLYLPSLLITILITQSFIFGVLLSFVLDIILSYIVLYIISGAAGGIPILYTVRAKRRLHRMNVSKAICSKPHIIKILKTT